MRSIWIEQAISNLGGIIVIILQLGFIAVLTALIILIVTEIIKAAAKGAKKERKTKMNKVILMGRLTRDAQTRYTEGTEPMAISRFTLAVDRRVQRDQEGQSADFISCVAFGKTGQFMEKYGQQGTKFVIEGRIQTGSYTNKEGRKIYTTEVVVESVEFAESKAAAGDNQSRPQPAPDSGDGFMNIPDGVDDLPFT